jgi:DNA-binding response OmpR family regulator
MSTTCPTILISDDEPLMVSALAREARREGLHFISDTSSEHVVELVRRHQPEVVILDLNQRVDGRDLLARLKRDPETARAHVVVLSSVEDQFTRTLCLQLGADDYQTKPMDPTFMTRIARTARAKAGAPAPVQQPAT